MTLALLALAWARLRSWAEISALLGWKGPRAPTLLWLAAGLAGLLIRFGVMSVFDLAPAKVSWALALVLAPLTEEILFRGLFVGAAMRSGWSRHLTLLVVSSTFLAVHASQYPIAALLSLVPIAFYLTWLRLKFDSLWPCLLAHASYNLLEVF